MFSAEQFMEAWAWQETSKFYLHHREVKIKIMD